MPRLGRLPALHVSDMRHCTCLDDTGHERMTVAAVAAWEDEYDSLTAYDAAKAEYNAQQDELDEFASESRYALYDEMVRESLARTLANWGTMR